MTVETFNSKEIQGPIGTVNLITSTVPALVNH